MYKKDLVYDVDKFSKEEKLRRKMYECISFKKRTEHEMRKAFTPVTLKLGLGLELLEEIISTMKENRYIDDVYYVKIMVKDFKAITKFSVKEMKYKLLQRGIDKEIIRDFFMENKDDLGKHEIKIANIIKEKYSGKKNGYELKAFLLRKGFMSDTISQMDFSDMPDVETEGE